MSKEAVIFMGIQASGKSTFYASRFFRTHLRINLDMLRTRHREDLVFKACLAAGQSFVVDNTNPTKRDRARYLLPAREQGFATVGYCFQSGINDSIERNAARDVREQVPELAIRGTHAKFEMPALAEGFDELHYVVCEAGRTFSVLPWTHEV